MEHHAHSPVSYKTQSSLNSWGLHSLSSQPQVSCFVSLLPNSSLFFHVFGLLCSQPPHLWPEPVHSPSTLRSFPCSSWHSHYSHVLGTNYSMSLDRKPLWTKNKSPGLSVYKSLMIWPLPLPHLSTELRKLCSRTFQASSSDGSSYSIYLGRSLSQTQMTLLFLEVCN